MSCACYWRRDAECSVWLHSVPVVLTGCMDDWPAMTCRPWSDMSYLKRVAGLRTVRLSRVRVCTLDLI